MTDCDSSNYLVYSNAFKKFNKNDKEGKMHFDKQKLDKLKKITKLPINNSSKETLMRLIRKPTGTHQITDIVKVLKTDKNSVTVHAKLITENNITEDVIVKILKDSERVQDELKIFNRDEDGTIKTESLKLFQHENVVVLKMLKNYKTLEQVLDESTNLHEVFKEILELAYKSREFCWNFWRFNMGSSGKRVIYHENSWKILSLDQCERRKNISKEHLGMNLVQILEIFKSFGLRINEMEEIFMEFSRVTNYSQRPWRSYSYEAFNIIFQKYFVKGCKDLKEFIY